MDIDTQIDLEVRIAEEIEALEKDLVAGEEGTAPPEALDGTIGRLSRQDSLMQQELAKDAQRRRTLRLRRLKEAMQRMDDGSFGLCLGCGVEIDDARLIETPEASLCSACAAGLGKGTRP
jgi:DnaK suppressor protein